MSLLIRLIPPDAPADAYGSAIITENALGRPTLTGRHRALRHLRELYGLTPSCPAFVALRQLWQHDPRAGAQLAGLLAFHSDELLRATFTAVEGASVGEVVASSELAEAARHGFGTTLNQASLARLGRNAAASWTQTGHLVGRTGKRRATLHPRPAAVALALYLGQLESRRGAFVLDSPWTGWFGVSTEAVGNAVEEAVRLGFVDIRRAGGMIEVGFPSLHPASGSSA